MLIPVTDTISMVTDTDIIMDMVPDITKILMKYKNKNDQTILMSEIKFF